MIIILNRVVTLFASITLKLQYFTFQNYYNYDYMNFYALPHHPACHFLFLVLYKLFTLTMLCFSHDDAPIFYFLLAQPNSYIFC